MHQFLATYFAAAVFILTSIMAPAQAREVHTLPRSTPEKEGVSSQGILRFIDAVERSSTELHSVMVLRHGKVIAEGWWNPYRPDLKHTMYSVSKSFTSTAVGFAVSEKRMSVDDKVVSFFPNELPDTVSANLAALRVRDLLSMSVGQEPDPTMSVRGGVSNWVKKFLSTPIVRQPGSKFLYNSLGSYMLSAIIQKVTGQKVLDYITPRLFRPLGISGIDWETDPLGINTGGWGLRLKTEDMAKFGQLYLQHGMWNGRQVLPKGWVEEATTMKILQSPDMPQAARDTSDWQQGYGYQMWRCRNNAFRGDGAFGQFIIMMPDQDAVVVITAETTDMQAEINLVWKHILPAMQTGPLSPDPAAASELKKKLASLALPVQRSASAANAARTIDGKTFTLETNERNVRALSFAFEKNRCTVTFAIDSAMFPVRFGDGAWLPGMTEKRGPDLINAARAAAVKPIDRVTWRVTGSYRWIDAATLELTLRYIESPHTEKFVCSFADNSVSVAASNSLDKGRKIYTLKGALKR